MHVLAWNDVGPEEAMLLPIRPYPANPNAEPLGSGLETYLYGRDQTPEQDTCFISPMQICLQTTPQGFCIGVCTIMVLLMKLPNLHLKQLVVMA